MTAAVVAELSAMGVTVACSGPGKIRLTVEAGEVPAEAVAIARNHKPELVAYLRPNCSPHNDAGNYIGQPATNRPVGPGRPVAFVGVLSATARQTGQDSFKAFNSKSVMLMAWRLG